MDSGWFFTPRIVITERGERVGLIAYSHDYEGACWNVYDTDGVAQPGLYSSEPSLTDALNAVRCWERA